MKKLLLGILVVALLAGGAWAYHTYLYVEDPSKAYLRIVAAAMLGDEKAFLDGFTDDARPLVAGLLSLSRGDEVGRSKRHPYHYLVTENVEGYEVDGERAWIRLRRMGDSSTATYDVPLLRAGNSWKIDALKFTGKERSVDNAR